MRALVFADRLGAELAPLTETLSVPLLPVAGKELLIYTIEDLVAAGVRDLVVVASAHGDQLGASSLGDGQRWGVNIRYVLSRGEEPPSAVWGRLNLLDGGAVVVLRGDVLRAPAVQGFLEQAQNQAATSAFCDLADPRASLVLLRPGCSDPGALLDCLHWPLPTPLPTAGGCVIETAKPNCIGDLRSFHAANLDLVAGRLPGLAVAGRSVALGLQAGRKAKLSPKSLKKGVAYVGANSRVHPEAELLGEVVIGDDVVVDRGATIRDSVIMPRTYVGELVEVGNAIVSTAYLMRVDTGVTLRIGEAFLLADLTSVRRRSRVSLVDRLVGVLLLVLSLPLWPMAVVAAALGGEGLLKSREMVGNRPSRSFSLKQWNTRIPVLRYLPGLIAAVRGDLRLVGVSPLTPEESAARTEDWQMVRDQAPVGLLGPTQLTLAEDAPLEERLLSDAFYTRQQSAPENLRYLLLGLKMLLNGEAWRRSDSRA